MLVHVVSAGLTLQSSSTAICCTSQLLVLCMDPRLRLHVFNCSHLTGCGVILICTLLIISETTYFHLCSYGLKNKLIRKWLLHQWAFWQNPLCPPCIWGPRTSTETIAPCSAPSPRVEDCTANACEHFSNSFPKENQFWLAFCLYLIPSSTLCADHWLLWAAYLNFLTSFWIRPVGL